jgi:hypothetical protein
MDSLVGVAMEMDFRRWVEVAMGGCLRLPDTLR